MSIDIKSVQSIQSQVESKRNQFLAGLYEEAYNILLMIIANSEKPNVEGASPEKPQLKVFNPEE